MKMITIYDSQYGNTKKIAQTINYNSYHVSQVKTSDLKNVDLIIIGSPTQGGRPTPAITDFIEQLPSEILKKAKFACFDTGFDSKSVSWFLKILISIIGYAAPKMARKISAAGGQVLSTQTFIVIDKKGPLLSGELARAKKWTDKIVDLLK